MGTDVHARDNWNRIRELAEKLNSPHADKIFVAKDYTKADLRRDLLASIPFMSEPVWGCPDWFAARRVKGVE